MGYKKLVVFPLCIANMQVIKKDPKVLSNSCRPAMYWILSPSVYQRYPLALIKPL